MSKTDNKSTSEIKIYSLKNIISIDFSFEIKKKIQITLWNRTQLYNNLNMKTVLDYFFMFYSKLAVKKKKSKLRSMYTDEINILKRWVTVLKCFYIFFTVKELYDSVQRIMGLTWFTHGRNDFDILGHRKRNNLENR